MAELGAGLHAYDSVLTKREITGGSLQNEWFGSNEMSTSDKVISQDLRMDFSGG